jgi:hypothetical protein
VTTRRLLAAGACSTVAGIGIAATAPILGTAPTGRIEAQQTVGGIVVLAGWALLAWGIHRFGRERED